MNFKMQYILGKMLQKISMKWWLIAGIFELTSLSAIVYGIYSLFTGHYYTAIGCIPFPFICGFIVLQIEIQAMNYYNRNQEKYEIWTRLELQRLDSELSAAHIAYKKSF